MPTLFHRLLQKPTDSEWFVRKRLGKHEHPWGVYQRLGGQDIRVAAFKTEQHARVYAAAQTISA